MSGGSYNYLYSLDAEEFLESEGKQGLIGCIRQRLENSGYRKAAEYTAQIEKELAEAGEIDNQSALESKLRRIDEKLAEISAVWKAVEYVDSFDWSENDLRDEIAIFERNLK